MLLIFFSPLMTFCNFGEFYLQSGVHFGKLQIRSQRLVSSFKRSTAFAKKTDALIMSAMFSYHHSFCASNININPCFHNNIVYFMYILFLHSYFRLFKPISVLIPYSKWCSIASARVALSFIGTRNPFTPCITVSLHPGH